MRALTWVLVVVVAFVAMGCAKKREELPQIEPADVAATPAVPTPTPAPAVIETPAPTPAPVPARVEKPPVTRPPVDLAPASTYTVKTGDTLISISRNLYGDDRSWRKIYEANKSKIGNPDKLKIGTVLAIPPK